MDEFQIEAYNFYLPEERIAQHPAERREESRLLRVDCGTGKIKHGLFSGLPGLLQPDDLLVVNDTKVFPARLQGRKETGGRIELLLLEYPAVEEGSGVLVPALARSSKRPRPGSKILFGPDLEAEIIELRPGGAVLIRLNWQGKLNAALERYGSIPLPPYIHRDGKPHPEDRKRYQTVYAREHGAIAAPTAGLHFTPEMLAVIKEMGVEIAPVTLHVGYATFAPVRVKDIRDHEIHAEYVTVGMEVVRAVERAREKGGRVWAVGTTSARALEFAACGEGRIRSVAGEACRLYIYPGYEYQVVDNLITNFHLPKSSLLFMVSAFAGRERVMAAYEEALRLEYRFYSYGDAMVLLKG
ncbi:tRNA preQ1(34) S-adenosylmethionine ribosyltransferase-isomerase QueA [Desulfobacterota bacterium M19]